MQGEGDDVRTTTAEENLAMGKGIYSPPRRQEGTIGKERKEGNGKRRRKEELGETGWIHARVPCVSYVSFPFLSSPSKGKPQRPSLYTPVLSVWVVVGIANLNTLILPPHVHLFKWFGLG